MRAALMVLIALAGKTPEQLGPIVVLDVGTYAKDELPGHARESGWLALCSGPRGTELVPVRPQVVPFRSLLLEDGPRDKSGREVKASGCPKAHVLVKAPGLKPGPVASAERRGDELSLGPNSYLARTEGPPANVEI